MYLLILVLPLIGSLVSGFGGRWLGSLGASVFSALCVLTAALISLGAFYEIGFSGTTCHISLAPWIESGLLQVSWGFLFDSIAVTMLVVITLVSFLVHIYSVKYMETDPHRPRFMAYLEVFTFFMLVLVTSDNLMQMFVGWEGVGLASYLLINFWYTRLSANQSAIKALVVNRVGDLGLSLGILVIFSIFNSLDYAIIFSSTPLVESHVFSFFGMKIHAITLAAFFIFVGAVGKSAQLGLHTWLPDAMEGPTPVSALIHAATMVTAGVFLILRFSPLIEFSPNILFILVLFGSLTAFFAAMTGTFQNDLKKVIAYSTCSQLGYMVFSCGMSCYDVSLFHLVNHAFFKALLFLCAGSVIHAVSNEQDMRRMGSLKAVLPLTYSLMLIGSFALAGFPFLAGFYSKDIILEMTQALTYSNLNTTYVSFACWLGGVSVIFTSFYSFRLIYLTFLNSSNLSRISFSSVHESSFLMSFPLVILGIGSIFVGYSLSDLFIGPGSDFWQTSIFTLPSHSLLIEAEWLPKHIKWLPFLLSVVGILLASAVNLIPSTSSLANAYPTLTSFFAFLINKKWYWDVFYNRFVVLPVLRFGYVVSFKLLDRGFIELSGPYGFSKFISLWSRILSTLQTGQLTHYVFYIVLGLFFFLSVAVFNFYQTKFHSHLLTIFFIFFYFV
uniref:NADH-ubiquinone oxidoreductase chain 5 n=1 Tax=Gloiopeltis furcata TaxID=42017 RepID=A0A5A4SEH8_9FLOR|nr:NADH dehydrogenase subunit 5 [Gloiopeltis furcata]BBK20788.1 NADH dehydrogenase subunit 5 [Gloiopeltis furcata]